jgi:hypothetical protein
MIDLDDVSISAQQVQLKLSLEWEDRYQVVKSHDLSAAENELVEFEQVISMLIYIHLKGSVERMCCDAVVV